MSKPSDRFSETIKIENQRPAGGEQRPSRLPLVTEKPAPTSDKFGGFGK
jgi:hypothetical protein